MDSKNAMLITAGVATSMAIGWIHIYRAYIKKRRGIPTKWKAVGILKKMYIYPLRGCRPLDLRRRADCTKRGLKQVRESDGANFQLQDRHFVVYHEESREFRTGRNFPKTVLIEISATDNDNVVLKAPDMESLVFQIPKNSKNLQVKIKQFRNEEILCLDCGDTAAQWISKFLLGSTTGLRIAFNDGSFKRDISKVFQPEIKHYRRGLSNSSVGLSAWVTSLHLISEPSLRDLNRRIGKDPDYISEVNFRPNLFIDGDIEPFAEDEWIWIKIGDVVMKSVMLCPRCMFTTIDPDTALIRKDREPLNTLEKFRKCENPLKRPEMGTLLEVVNPGYLSIGDTVFIEEK